MTTNLLLYAYLLLCIIFAAVATAIIVLNAIEGAFHG